MTFSLVERGDFPNPVNGWPLPPEPLFVGSDQFDKLTRDLKLFVNGEVLGRSYLIAGHRGAGKTALVIRAVQDLRTYFLRESVKVDSQLPPQEGLQRPLIIKLHGPSLLALDPLPARPAPEPAPEPATSEAAAANGGSAAAKTGALAQNPKPMPVEPGAHAALVQITVGLYRALAAEVGLGYGVHARAQPVHRPADFVELSAQLAFELDNGPDPATMRRYWAAIGRLADGVLWPPEAEATLSARRVFDQGVREVVAIATAAQAFQVCTGQVTYGWTVKNSDTVTAETIAKGTTDLKDVIGRVSTLGVGALTGVSLLGAQAAGPVAAIGAGLAVWLIGNFSISWSTTRKRVRDQQLDYSFIRDRTVTTLDRDLPLVIGRVRRAGLAPVFVVDELDKVEAAREKISDLVDKLKHLITDYGFFCFLVNRDTFDEIEERVERLAYPVDHTYFSQRLLVRAEPQRLMAYLARLIESESATAAFARTVFALTVMHRAKFNLAELNRAIADVAGAGGTLRVAETELTSRKQLFIATIQLAINEILREPGLVGRIRDDSPFGQLVIDTLYYPSRWWERGDKVVPASRPDLAKYLQDRMRGQDAVQARQGRASKTGRVGAAAAGAPAPRAPSESDLDQLHALLIRLLEDLGDFPAFRKRMGSRLAFDDVPAEAPVPDKPAPGLPHAVRLESIFPGGNESLIAARRNQGFNFRFAVDSQGETRKATPRAWSGSELAKARALLQVYRAFDLLLKGAGVGLDEMTEARLLPQIATRAAFAVSRGNLAAAIRARTSSPEASTALDQIGKLSRAIADRGAKLGAALLLTASVSRDAGSSHGTLERLARLIDFEAPPATWVSGWTPPAYPVPPTATEMRNWLDGREAQLLPPADAAAIAGLDRYDLLSKRLLDHFHDREAALDPFFYEELIIAARGEAPYRYLRAKADTMAARDWSGLALEAMPRQTEPARAPYWLLIASLRGLGFGDPLLDELSDEELQSELTSQRWRLETPSLTADRCMILARDMASGARPAKPGVLLVRADQDRVAGADPPSRRRPTLVVGESDSKHYVSALLWLRAMEAFAGLADEHVTVDDGATSEGQTL